MNDKIIDLNKRGKYGSAKDKAKSLKELQELLKILKDPKSRMIIILCGFAGFRVGELTQLRKEWLNRIDFNGKEVLSINIPNECRDINNKYSIWRPKTKRERTTYLFDKELFLEVEHFYLYNESINLKIRGLQNRTYKLIGVSIHSLRASATNYYRFINMPIEVTSVFLGHKEIKTTQKHYSSLNKAMAENYLLNTLNKGV